MSAHVDLAILAHLLADVLLNRVRLREEHDQAPLGLHRDQFLGRLEIDRFEGTMRAAKSALARAPNLELQPRLRRIGIDFIAMLDHFPPGLEQNQSQPRRGSSHELIRPAAS
jgi:hypothetical protein